MSHSVFHYHPFLELHKWYSIRFPCSTEGVNVSHGIQISDSVGKSSYTDAKSATWIQVCADWINKP